MIERIDIHGRRITDTVFRTRCEECGMGLISAAEFHPYEACEIYKATKDSSKTWRSRLEGYGSYERWVASA